MVFLVFLKPNLLIFSINDSHRLQSMSYTLLALFHLLGNLGKVTILWDTELLQVLNLYIGPEFANV